MFGFSTATSTKACVQRWSLCPNDTQNRKTSHHSEQRWSRQSHLQLPLPVFFYKHFWHAVECQAELQGWQSRAVVWNSWFISLSRNVDIQPICPKNSDVVIDAVFCTISSYLAEIISASLQKQSSVQRDTLFSQNHQIQLQNSKFVPSQKKPGTYERGKKVSLESRWDLLPIQTLLSLEVI